MQFQIEAYITQEHEIPTANTQKLIQTVCFKPSPSDSPISAALGPNSWLWLSAIITSSFIMFLLLLAIVTRYYIYPIDHDSALPLQLQNFVGYLFGMYLYNNKL